MNCHKSQKIVIEIQFQLLLKLSNLIDVTRDLGLNPKNATLKL